MPQNTFKLDFSSPSSSYFIIAPYNVSYVIKNGVLYGIDLNYYENAVEKEYVIIVKGTMAKQVCTH